MDEHEAVARLKKGDVGALEALVRRYHARAGRAAYLIVRDHALAEDVAQGAFVRAYEGIGGFDEGRPFGPWFMRIVVNEAVGAARGRERAASYEGAGAPASWLTDPAAGPHELAEEAEERRRVWAALAKLPPAQRAAIVQRYYLGMSEAEMAGDAARPPGTIKSRLHAARRAYRGSCVRRAGAGPNDAAGRPPTVPFEGGKAVSEQRRRLEGALRGCAEGWAPRTADPWPAIRERLVRARTEEEDMAGGEPAGSGTRRPLRPVHAPVALALAALSVLILGLIVFAASGSIRELVENGPPSPAAPDPGEATNPERSDGLTGAAGAADRLFAHYLPGGEGSPPGEEVGQTKTADGAKVTLERAYADEDVVVVGIEARDLDGPQKLDGPGRMGPVFLQPSLIGEEGENEAELPPASTSPTPAERTTASSMGRRSSPAPRRSSRPRKAWRRAGSTASAWRSPCQRARCPEKSRTPGRSSSTSRSPCGLTPWSRWARRRRRAGSRSPWSGW